MSDRSWPWPSDPPSWRSSKLSARKTTVKIDKQSNKSETRKEKFTLHKKNTKGCDPNCKQQHHQGQGRGNELYTTLPGFNEVKERLVSVLHDQVLRSYSIEQSDRNSWKTNTFKELTIFVPLLLVCFIWNWFTRACSDFFSTSSFDLIDYTHWNQKS